LEEGPSGADKAAAAAASSARFWARARARAMARARGSSGKKGRALLASGLGEIGRGGWGVVGMAAGGTDFDAEGGLMGFGFSLTGAAAGGAGDSISSGNGSI